MVFARIGLRQVAGIGAGFLLLVGVPCRSQEAPQPASPPASPQQQGSVCDLYVYTATGVAGVTTKSAFTKFALGTLLPAVAGSVAGTAAGPALATQGATAGNGLTANKRSEVPSVIADAFTRDRQAAAIRTTLGKESGPLASSAPMIDDGELPAKEKDIAKAMASRLATSGHDCARLLTINAIAFEHSKDYSSRNAVVVLSSLAEYARNKKKPVIEVHDESRTAIQTSPLGKDAESGALVAELDKAFGDALLSLTTQFDKQYDKKHR